MRATHPPCHDRVLLGAFGTAQVQPQPGAQGSPPPPPAASPTAPAAAPPQPASAPADSRFSSNEIVNAGHRFFGGVSRGLAQVVEKAVSQWGLPNGYILGEEASGAFVAGLRYGEGMLYTKNAGDLKVYWQGPSHRLRRRRRRRPHHDAGLQSAADRRDL